METIAKLWPLWIALGVMTLVTFIVYAYDKHIAKQNPPKNASRISVRSGTRRFPRFCFAICLS